MPNLEDSRYPSTDQMPELAGPQQGSPEAATMAGADNPVIKALQTIQTWISAMKEKGMPGIDEIEQNFISMLQGVSQTGQENPENSQEPPMEEPETQAPGGPVPMGGSWPNAMPVNANKSAKTLI